MKFINLTPHSVNLANGAVYPPSGNIARCQERWVDIVDGIAQEFEYHTPEIPDQKEGVGYIVSLPVAQAAPHRNDLFIAVGQTRDEQGRINGCTALARI